MMRSPAAHFVPAVACIFLTVPAMGESITISIFIADRTKSGCLEVTCKKKEDEYEFPTDNMQHSSHLISFLDLDFENLSRHGQPDRPPYSRQSLRPSFYLLQFRSFSLRYFAHSVTPTTHLARLLVLHIDRPHLSIQVEEHFPLGSVVHFAFCQQLYCQRLAWLDFNLQFFLLHSLLQICRLTSICSAMSNPVKNTRVGSLSTGPYRCRKTSNSWNTSGNIAWDITSTSLSGRSYFNSRSFFILSKSAGGILSPARPSIFGLPRRT
ncbi:hypothetical protein WR25_08842 [Diploscapter pachys]|uniref:Uncharacterized protein n=1 Tax=Diploscapter pachys TaxID=2018661 RepID=A0A2A2JB35_9BILA|nr:hypothetical protein WR25_08842 [Diploscapter pachys]